MYSIAFVKQSFCARVIHYLLHFRMPIEGFIEMVIFRMYKWTCQKTSDASPTHDWYLDDSKPWFLWARRCYWDRPRHLWLYRIVHILTGIDAQEPADNGNKESRFDSKTPSSKHQHQSSDWISSSQQISQQTAEYCPISAVNGWQ